MNSIRPFTVTAILFLLFSCAKASSVTQQKTRDNVIDIPSDLIVSIDDNLPILHTCDIIMTGDTILFDDHLNGDFKFTAYDIFGDKTLGRFGKPGGGPGELANYGGIFYDEASGNLYVTEAGQGKLLQFYLPQAISDAGYIPSVRYAMDFTGGNNAYTCPHYINDSTVICAAFVRNKQSLSFSTHIGRLNMLTKSVTVIDTLPDTDNIRYLISVSPRHNRIFAAGRIKDEMRIYDLDGHLVQTIHGPDYDDRIENRRFYFSCTAFCNDKILAIYGGGSEKKGHDIVVMDINGKYLNTLRFDMPLHDIKYHDKTDRLYLVTDDTPQFGYIENFSKILDGKEEIRTHLPEPTSTDDAAEKKAAVSPEDSKAGKVKILVANHETNAKSTQGPLIFIDANTHGATKTDHLNVGAYKEGDLYRYTISILNRSDKPVSIKSFSLPDDYFKAEWSTVGVMVPNMIGFLYLTCKQPLEDKPYHLIIEYNDPGLPPQILHMTLFASGAQLYNKLHGSE